ncbi:hypothetical protein BJY01DRAFT_255626 [Aspergillus pseudoustus]|uniref:Zn(2)-C6 fungal-type domain-containing protein n=1 Tax=Aspergillus pseudoustus TaxID=1810923 RepID=A0ABR4IIS8_9EURO
MTTEAGEDANSIGQPGTIGVTRRLALNACEPCRQRKAKCDEGQPQCGRCTRLRLSCHYKELSVKKDPVLLHIRKSLANLESQMEEMRSLLHRDRSFADGSPENTYTATIAYREQDTIFAQGPTERASSPLPSTPLHHSTAPQNILLWPCLQASLPNLNSVYGLRGEIAEHNTRDAMNVPLSSEHLTTHDNLLSSLTMSQIKCLTKAFFDDLSIYSPLLVESEFADRILGPVLAGGTTSELDVCIVLLVLFLGGKALVDQDNQAIPDDPQGALDAFLDPVEADLRLSQLSLRIRHNAEISWRCAQALLLTGLFYSQQINVLDHFQAVQRACTTIMILLQCNPRPTQTEVQIYWVAQLLAEFELPASGIGRYEDLIPFPFSEYRNAEEPREVHRVTFLAHLALRKLLNRIHSNIYGHDHRHTQSVMGLTASSSLSTGFSASMSIIEELDHQLELWRQHLPTELSFPTLAQMNPWQHEYLTRHRTASPFERAVGALRARYCAAKSIILRPFLYTLLNSPPQENISARDQENAQLCMLAVLQAVLRQGILRDSIRAIPMPVNLIRCFFAGAIVMRLVYKRPDLHSLLPADWKVIYDIQDRIEADAAHLSPTIAEDMQILRRLDYMPHNGAV